MILPDCVSISFYLLFWFDVVEGCSILGLFQVPGLAVYHDA